MNDDIGMDTVHAFNMTKALFSVVYHRIIKFSIWQCQMFF